MADIVTCGADSCISTYLLSCQRELCTQHKLMYTTDARLEEVYLCLHYYFWVNAVYAIGTPVVPTWDSSSILPYSAAQHNAHQL
jgi:hypothetical protein